MSTHKHAHDAEPSHAAPALTEFDRNTLTSALAIGLEVIPNAPDLGLDFNDRPALLEACRALIDRMPEERARLYLANLQSALDEDYDPEVVQRTNGTFDNVGEMLDQMERFLGAITWSDQDSVMLEREPWRWELALLLDSQVKRPDLKDREYRMFMIKLELEALMRHPDVLANAVRILYDKLLAVAPDLPTLTVAQHEQ